MLSHCAFSVADSLIAWAMGNENEKGMTASQAVRLTKGQVAPTTNVALPCAGR